MTIAELKEQYEGMQEKVNEAVIDVGAAREELNRATEELASIRIEQDGIRGAYIAFLEHPA